MHKILEIKDQFPASSASVPKGTGSMCSDVISSIKSGEFTQAYQYYVSNPGYNQQDQ